MSVTGSAVRNLIIVSGLPASGKSTLCNHLVDTWGVDETRWASIDDVLRIQCPPGQGTDRQGSPFYTRDGDLFIIDSSWRPAQLTLAARGLGELAMLMSVNSFAVSGQFSTLILELATTELELLLRGQLPLASRRLLLQLDTSESTRRHRNYLRPADRRLPREVVDYFESAKFETSLDRLAKVADSAGFVTVTIDFERDRGSCLEDAESVARKYLAAAVGRSPAV